MPAKKDETKQEQETPSLDELLSGLPDQIKTQVDEAVDARIEELRTEYRKQADEALTKVSDKLEEAIEDEVGQKVKEAVEELSTNASGELVSPEDQLPAVGEAVTYVVVGENTHSEIEYAAQVTAVGSDGTTISLTYWAPNARAGRPIQMVPFGQDEAEERPFFWRYPTLGDPEAPNLTD